MENQNAIILGEIFEEFYLLNYWIVIYLFDLYSHLF